MMALDPNRVQPDRIPEPAPQPLPTYTILPEPQSLVPSSGVLATAVGSSPAIGRLLVGKLVASMERILRTEFPVAP